MGEFERPVPTQSYKEKGVTKAFAKEGEHLQRSAMNVKRMKKRREK